MWPTCRLTGHGPSPAFALHSITLEGQLGAVPSHGGDSGDPHGFDRRRSASTDEDAFTKALERYTAQTPSSALLAAAVGAMGLSLLSQLGGQGTWGNFIAQWVPTIIVMGVYNKLVKLESHARRDRGHSDPSEPYASASDMSNRAFTAELGEQASRPSRGQSRMGGRVTAGRITLRHMVALVVAVAMLGIATSKPGGAQTNVETQRGVPPAPSAASPEYAPSPVAPTGRPSLTPPPGEPALAPAPGTIGDRGQPAASPGRRILGLRPMTAVVVGFGVLGLLVLVVSGMTRKRRGALHGARGTRNQDRL
jgi:hypothetical protein